MDNDMALNISHIKSCMLNFNEFYINIYMERVVYTTISIITSTVRWKKSIRQINLAGTIINTHAATH